MIDQIAVEARTSEYVDEKSGVSARLPISAYENVVSSVERRMLLNNEQSGVARISDLTSAIPAIVGKIEMVYEGEQEGAVNVAHLLIAAAIRALAPTYFSSLEQAQDKHNTNAREQLMPIAQWFEAGNELDLLSDASEKEYKSALAKVNGLVKAAKLSALNVKKGEDDIYMELLLHAMAEYSMLDRKLLENNFKFQDYFSSVLPKDF